MKYNSYFASVKNPNTPESDKQPEVMHVVNFFGEGGVSGRTEVMAECPMDAIKKVQMRHHDAPPEVEGL